ncbi:hypothetical protein TCAL_11962, partial [Tigriopus californicus]
QVIFAIVVLVGLSFGLPQGRNQPQAGDFNTDQASDPESELQDPIFAKEIIHCQTKEVIYVNEDQIDAFGCLVGPCGDKVCPNGAVGVGQDRATFRGNQGPPNTGSNGNAGPIDQAGRPVDPAAVTYLKQIEAYKAWELQQIENNKKIIG